MKNKPKEKDINPDTNEVGRLHYTELCPKCNKPLIAKNDGGVKCTNCDYWFCY